MCSAVALSLYSTAQLNLSATRFGVTAGANYSRVRNAHNPSGARYTWQGGALALVPIGKTNQFFLQPEVGYYGAGESGRNKDSKGMQGYDAVYANNYISVPLYFKGYFSEAQSEFYGMIGPRFNFLIDQKVTGESREVYRVDRQGKAASFNFAVGLGIGYSYLRQLELALKYDIGLSNTYPDLDESRLDPNSSKKKSEQVLSLTLSYIFN